MVTVDSKKDEVKKFAEKSPCICFNLRKAARAITQIYDDMFRDLELTATQAAILTTVRMIGPLRVSELAEAMATDRTTLTRNLRPLERDGYIKIEAGQDRRAKEVAITKSGENISLKAFKKWQKFQTNVTKVVSEEKMEKLCRDLCSMIKAIQKC